MKTILKLVTCIFFLGTVSCFSQSENTELSVPNSIYFSNSLNKNYQFSTFSLNSKFNFSSYQFLNIEKQNFRKGQLNIHPEAFEIKPSQFIFDSYTKLKENEYLNKSAYNISELYNRSVKPKNL